MNLTKKDLEQIKKIRKELSKTKLFDKGTIAGSCGLASWLIAKHLKGAKVYGTDCFSHIWVEYKSHLLDITYSQTSLKRRPSVLFVSKISKSYLNYKKSFPGHRRYLKKRMIKDYGWVLKEFPNLAKQL